MKAESSLTWKVPVDITFGTPLDATQLNAMADRPGSYVYTPAAGTQLNAGNAQLLSVSFIPDDTNFDTATAIVLINVLKLDPVITWNNPAAIMFGGLLSDTQLNATADVAGTFVYTPASGTLLNAGMNQSLSVVFTPADAANFNTATKGVTINVRAANMDFGDASSRYPVTLAQDGARHTSGSLFLGSAVDAEPDGQQTDDATGDDRDEDGVVVVASVVAIGDSITRSSVAVTSSGIGKLDAWIDWNQDGDWSDAGEQILRSQGVIPGTNLLSFIVPAGARPGDTAARFRLSSAGGLTPTGAAPDGEVEDYFVMVVDGDATGGAAVEVRPTASGTLDVLADGNDVVILRGAIELFRAPGAKLKRLGIAGTDGDDTLNLANLDAIFAGLIVGDAGLGNDSLRLNGSRHYVDLNNLAGTDFRGFETIDITGSGDNTLTLDFNAATNLASTSGRLRVVHDDGDVVNFHTGWAVALPEILANQFVHVVKQSGITIEVANTMPFQNPLHHLDTNRDGSISPLDALIIINRLNDSGPGVLAAPVSVVGFTEFFYFDTNGDRSVAPIDALQIINFLNDLTSQGEGEFTATGIGQRFIGTPDDSLFTDGSKRVRPHRCVSELARSMLIQPVSTTALSIVAVRPMIRSDIAKAHRTRRTWSMPSRPSSQLFCRYKLIG